MADEITLSFNLILDDSLINFFSFCLVTCRIELYFFLCTSNCVLLIFFFVQVCICALDIAFNLISVFLSHTLLKQLHFQKICNGRSFSRDARIKLVSDSLLKALS